MKPDLAEMLRSARKRPIFAFYLVATLVVAVIVALITLEVIDLGMSHFGQPAHRTHDVTYGLLFAASIAGVLVQLRRPEENVAGMLMALVPASALLVAGVLSQDSDAVFHRNPLRYAAAVIVVAALLHPAGRGFYRSLRLSRLRPVPLALLGVAAVPLLGLASTNLRLQRTITDEHAFMGHYGFMAALSFTVIALGVVASFRPPGWRTTAWAAGLLPALLGATSWLYPNATSSLSSLWAALAIAWGVTFIGVAATTREAEASVGASATDRTEPVGLVDSSP